MKTGNLAELDAFVAVARRGGFRSAAQELGVSPSAVSHAIANLEEGMDVRLFNRTTRSVGLTDAGEQFLAEVGPALEAIRNAREKLRDQGNEPTGTLRLNLYLLAARTILKPVILEYLRRFPQMTVELATEGALVDIFGEGFDAGVRLKEAVPLDMIAIPITPTQRMVVVGAPAYFQDRSVPKMPEDLRQHQCVRARMASGRVYRWEFEKRGQSLAIDVPGRLTLDEGRLIQDAVLAGAGLAFLPENLLAEDIAAGRLVRVLEDWTPAYPGLCLYYPSRRNVPAKLRALIDLIREIQR